MSKVINTYYIFIINDNDGPEVAAGRMQIDKPFRAIDPETGKSWQELIDIDSWARKYLIDEVFGNLDAYLIKMNEKYQFLSI